MILLSGLLLSGCASANQQDDGKWLPAKSVGAYTETAKAPQPHPDHVLSILFRRSVSDAGLELSGKLSEILVEPLMQFAAEQSVVWLLHTHMEHQDTYRAGESTQWNLEWPPVEAWLRVKFLGVDRADRSRPMERWMLVLERDEKHFVGCYYRTEHYDLVPRGGEVAALTRCSEYDMELAGESAPADFFSPWVDTSLPRLIDTPPASSFAPCVHSLCRGRVAKAANTPQGGVAAASPLVLTHDISEQTVKLWSPRRTGLAYSPPGGALRLEFRDSGAAGPVARLELVGMDPVQLREPANRRLIVLSGPASNSTTPRVRASVHGTSNLAALSAVETLKSNEQALHECMTSASGDDSATVTAKITLEKFRSIHLRRLSVKKSGDDQAAVACFRPILEKLSLEPPSSSAVRSHDNISAGATIWLRYPSLRRDETTQQTTAVAGAVVPDLDDYFDTLKRVITSPHSDVMRLKYCYERGLRLDPTLEGRVRFRVEIASSGQVSSAQIVESTLEDADVEGCMTRVWEAMAFRKPQADVAVLTMMLPFGS